MTPKDEISGLAQDIERQADAWANPDTSLLQRSQTRAPEFPLHTLGQWGNRVKDMARSSSAPVDYVIFALLAHVAALVGNGILVQPDAENVPDWQEPVALWVMLIGAPSSGKTPALKPFRDIFSSLEKGLKSEFKHEAKKHEESKTVAELARKAWEKQVEKAIKEGIESPALPDNAVMPDDIQAPQLSVIDTTIEKLAEILSHNPKGVLQLRDELAAWFQAMVRYSDASSRAQWLELYNGNSLRIDRVKFGKKSMEVPRALVSILGGIQPDRYRAVLNEADDGLFARFLYIWPEPTPLVRATPHGHHKPLRTLFEELNKIQFPTDSDTGTFLPFAANAADRFFSQRERTRKLAEEREGLVAGWVGKADGLIARLAAILCLMDWGETSTGALPKCVSLDVLERAILIWESYLFPMMLRACEDASESESERLARLVLKQIQRREAREINEREIYRNWQVPGMGRDAKKCAAALSVLQEAGWIRKAEGAEPATGRKRGDWQVNALLWEKVKDA